MKKRIVIISSILLLLSLLLVGLKVYNNINNNSDRGLKKLSNIQLLKSADASTVKQFKANYDTNEKELNSAKVYKVKQIDAKTKAHDLAGKFDIKIKNENKDENIYSVSSELGSILVSYNGGGFVYYNNSDTSGDKKSIPDNDECVKLATNFLKKVNLYDDGLKADKIGENYIDFGNDNKEIQSKDVYFSFKIDNLEVSSGNIIVQVGNSGSVMSVVYNKKELELINEYPIISKSDAINNANSGNSVYTADKSLSETAFVNKISLVYLDNGPFSDGFTEYQPVYMLEGSLDTSNSKEKFLAQVKAVKSEYIENSTNINNEENELKLKNSELNEYSDVFVNNKKVELSKTTKNILNDLLTNSELKIVSYGSSDEIAVKMNDVISSMKYADIKYEDKKIKYSLVKGKKSVSLKDSSFDIERIVIPFNTSIKTIYFYSKDQAVIVSPTTNENINILLQELRSQ